MELLDLCISCGQELAPWERNRSECLSCRDRVTESYGDETQDEEEYYIIEESGEVVVKCSSCHG